MMLALTHELPSRIETERDVWKSTRINPGIIVILASNVEYFNVFLIFYVYFQWAERQLHQRAPRRIAAANALLRINKAA
ncbi:hypothetical protein A0257_05190 [Hymenobacter psoromatis]|nr:hypothetical protein A0257_05190 [Hymenobacter psoromatis]